MSAIYGIVGGGERAELEAIGARLAHRGIVTHMSSPGAGVYLGVRRRTPGTPTADMAFDGWIDNAEHLAAELGLASPSADHHADRHAELALAVFHRFGPAGFAKLDGQFAAALWDPKVSRVWLVRDMWGTRPLYYASVRERWIFATEYKALLAVSELPARPNRPALQHLHCTKYVPPHASCLEGVRPVPPGTCMQLGGAGSSHAFLQLGAAIVEQPTSAHAATLRSAILEAAQRQTRGHSRIGVSLSAGIDSAITLAAAVHAAPGRVLHSFTAGFGPDDPDLAGARSVAQHFGTKHHEVFLLPEQIPAAMSRTVWSMEEPIGREEKLFYHILGVEAAKHVTLLLAGHNADALFGGMPRHLLASLAAKAGRLSRPVEELYRYTQTGVSPTSLLGRALKAACYGGRDLPPPVVIGGGPPPAGRPLPLGAHQPLTALLRSAALEDSNANSAIERIHAGLGLAFNSPFLDSEVARFAFTLPDRLKVRGLTQKYILRRAAAGLLPASVLKRPKGLPRLRHDRRVGEVLEGLADELLSPGQIRDRNLFDPVYVERVRRRPANGAYQGEHLYRLWSLLLTELWCRAFVDRRGAPVD
jgi:asparagine synthase (glutamine-hydrolysing)